MHLYPLCFLLLLSVPFASAAQNSTSAGVVIPVDDVTPATEPYNTFSFASVLQKGAENTIIVSAQQQEPLVPGYGNSFLRTVHLAYAQHHDLVLSPDDIWIQIALGVSIHLNENFAQLNAKVVHSPKKEELAIRMDGLSSLKTNDWQQLIDTFAVLAKNKVKPDFYRTMLPEFSTSTPETRAVLQTILLSSVKESLSLRAMSGCGIPNVVLLGTKKDWQKLMAHVAMLEQYDLGFWTKELQPVLQEFVNAFDGRADLFFWQRMYKYREGYMIEQMNGWIVKFFPYFTNAEFVEDDALVAQYLAENPGVESEGPLVRTAYYRNPYLKGDDYLFHPVDLWSLPASVCTVPLVWNNLLSANPAEHEQHLLLYAGFSGTRQDEKLRLRNNPVWYITNRTYYEAPEDAQEPFTVNSKKGRPDFVGGFWANDTLKDSLTAIYHPEKNTSFETGNEELKNELRKHLKQAFPKEDPAGTELTFILSHYGYCANPVVTGGKLSGKARAELALRLQKLNYRFEPSTISSSDTHEFFETIEYVPEFFPVNSLITLRF